MTQPIFALIDCNNFFVSCERLFRPDLEGKPVVVLSSNDGCVVSRSNEAKDIGIPMGAPIFKFIREFKQHEVVQFSANFELYGDISSRITSTLTSITPHIEVYSVDESFLDLSELHIEDYVTWAREVRAQVLKYIGIPVSIGIAPSKTLAKLAADRAKKDILLEGILSLAQTQKPSHSSGGWNDELLKSLLSQTPIQDVWGVGWKLTPQLKAEGVHTALNLAHFPIKRASQLMGVHGRQMVTELNGTSCLPLQKHHKPQQMIMRGRQFGEDTNQQYVVEAAIASLTAKAAAHLRREQRLARQAVVIIRTNRKKPGYRQLSATVKFATPTADTGIISAALVHALDDIFNPYELYHKADVMVFDLIPETAFQTDYFDSIQARPAGHEASQARMQVMDSLNTRFGKGTIYHAAENLSQAWRPRYNLGSPGYTSSWDDLPRARPARKSSKILR